MTALPAMADRVRVCYVQAYRAPEYVRGRTMREALSMAPGIELSQAVNTAPGIRRYWQALRALLRVRRELDPQVYVLGFRGHEMAMLVRWLTRDRVLVIDAMMSPYAALSEEAKFGPLGKLIAPLWRRIEASALRGADAVLTDTQAHARFYRETFGVPEHKLLAVPVGAVENSPSMPSQPALSNDMPLRVLFFGSFLPLHGIQTIVEAAARVADIPVAFRFIGGNRGQSNRLLKACHQAGVHRYSHERWLPFDRLVHEEIPRADVCLGGPFGGTLQARRVVTGKTSQCLASGRTTVVGRIDEDMGFIDKVNCLLVEQQDAVSLAGAIRWAHEHRDRLPGIGVCGRRLYEQRLSTQVVADRLAPLLQRLAVAIDAHAS